MPGEKRVISHPSPADALRQDEADVTVATTGFEVDLENALEPRAAVIRGRGGQSLVERGDAIALHHTDADEASGAEVLGEPELRGLGRQQRSLVPVLRIERHDNVVAERLVPVAPRRVRRDQRLELVGRKPGAPGDVERGEDRSTGMRRVVEYHRRVSLAGKALERVAFPAARALAGDHGEQSRAGETSGREEGAQQRGEIGTRGAQAEQQGWLRPIGKAPDVALAERED